MQSRYLEIHILVTTLFIFLVTPPTLGAYTENRYFKNNHKITLRDTAINCNTNQLNRDDYENAYNQMAKAFSNDLVDPIPPHGKYSTSYGTAQVVICNQASVDLNPNETTWKNFMTALDNECGQKNGGWARSKASPYASFGRDVTSNNDCLYVF